MVEFGSGSSLIVIVLDFQRFCTFEIFNHENVGNGKCHLSGDGPCGLQSVFRNFGCLVRCFSYQEVTPFPLLLLKAPQGVFYGGFCDLEGLGSPPTGSHYCWENMGEWLCYYLHKYFNKTKKKR